MGKIGGSGTGVVSCEVLSATCGENRKHGGVVS